MDRRLQPSLAMLRLALACVLVAAPASAQPDAADPDPRQELPVGVYAVIAQDGVAPLAVLRIRTEESWGRGDPRLDRRSWPTVMTRAVRLDALPRALRRELRGRVTVSDDEAVRCTAALGRPRLFRYVDAEESSEWDGEYEAPRLDDATVLRRAWDITEEWEMLVAPLRAMRGDCARGAWATRGTPRFGSGHADIRPEETAAFRTLASYGDLQATWTEEAREYDDDPSAVHWEERSAGANRRVHRFTAADGRRFHLVAAVAHDGCGDFTGSLWGLFEETAAGYRLLHEGSGVRLPRGLVDLTGDGVPEVLGFRRVDTVGVASADVAAIYTGCAC
jgi:hypothetical protein